MHNNNFTFKLTSYNIFKSFLIAGVNYRPSYSTDEPEDIGFGEDPTPPPVSSGGRQPEQAGGSKAPSIRPSVVLLSWISLLSLCLWFNG